MSHISSFVKIILVGAVSGISAHALAQAPTPQVGYFDIPAGFDFPADKQTLEGFRTTGNVSAQRKHVWNVFAGMTQPTPDNLHAIFETWYSEAEAFDTSATPQAVGPRRIVRRFIVPRQFGGAPGQPAPEAAGDALLSEVMFNFPNYNHFRTTKLFLESELSSLLQRGDPDPHFPNDKTVPAFPADSVSLKTIWWPVAKDRPTPLPVWDPETNPLIATGNSFASWKRVVAIDPTRQNIPPDETMTISFLNTPRPNSHVVGLDKFHAVVLDAQTAANAMANGRLRGFIKTVFGDDRPLQEGDSVVFLGSHLTTKEIDDWVWATFWWHDRPDAGPFAADRLDTVKGVWRNYLMNTAFDVNLPRESDGTPHVTFNPYVEAGFRQGAVSNCMNCHHRAVSSSTSFLPVFRGDPDPTDPLYGAGLLRTDFLWSIPFNTN
jgi:hypothetical protein